MSSQTHASKFCPKCGKDDDMMSSCDGCGEAYCANCDLPRCCKACDGIFCACCLVAGKDICEDCNIKGGEEEGGGRGICDICGYVRKPYEHPDTVKTCVECEGFSYCERCRDDGKVKITECCEGCFKCTDLLRCGNCSTYYCRNQCCQKDCKGCEMCDSVKRRREVRADGTQVTSVPWIYHCNACGENTCEDCIGCDEEGNAQCCNGKV